MKQRSNEPAFPQPTEIRINPSNTMQIIHSLPGLTVREEFAKAALMGFLASGGAGTVGFYAKCSVQAADALIEELDR